MGSLASRYVKHFLWKASITWEHFLKPFFFFLSFYGEQRFASTWHGLPLPSRTWCSLRVVIPLSEKQLVLLWHFLSLFPKGTRELCWAVRDEIKGKPLTRHFIISCHHQWAAAQLPDELGFGCLEKAGQGGRDQSRDKLSRSLGCAVRKRESGYQMQALSPCFPACKRHPGAKPSLPLDTLIILEQSVDESFEGNLRINLAAFQALP